ncbi:MAG: NosD domain-containing protein, partial [Candidatus Thermoplasmatota archaeon]
AITDWASHKNSEGVLCYSSSNNDFSNLTIYNNSGHGLRLRCSEWNQIVACAIYNNYGHNVFFEGVSHNTLMGCICYNSSNDGIRFSSSNNNILTECITYNNYCGISLDNSSGNSMSYCTAFNNSHGVMLVSSSDNNTITNCNVYNNFYGIYISSSSNNLIYNNYFDNTNNAYSYGGSGNRWNITKTLGGNIVNGAYLGGNYWSDYAGIDADGDGLGDVPYLILGSTREQDKLPLIRGVALLQQLPNLFLYVGIIIVIIVICFGIMAIKKSKK